MPCNGNNNIKQSNSWQHAISKSIRANTRWCKTQTTSKAGETQPTTNPDRCKPKSLSSKPHRNRPNRTPSIKATKWCSSISSIRVRSRSRSRFRSCSRSSWARWPCTGSSRAIKTTAALRGRANSNTWAKVKTHRPDSRYHTRPSTNHKLYNRPLDP